MGFSPERDLPDLTGKVAIVTGSNTGIGYETVKALALKGARCYMASRNEAKVTVAISALEEAGVNPGLVSWLKLDLLDLEGCRRAAQDFMAKENRLDILVNNAAIVLVPDTLPQKYKCGICEPMLANHFGHFVFTTTLLPLLKKTSGEQGSDVRIVNVSSRAHENAPPSRFTTLADFNLPSNPGFFASLVRYGHTKLANILFTNELQRRFDEENIPILCTSLHPGLGMTFPQKLPALISQIIGYFFPASGAALTSVWAAAAEAPRREFEKYKGAYLTPVGRLGGATKQAMDTELAKELWETTERLLSAGLLDGRTPEEPT